MIVRTLFTVTNDTQMWVGWLEVELRLGDVHSLKQKRSVLRPVIHQLRRSTEASVAETGFQQLYRRAQIGVAITSGDATHLTSMLDRAERLLVAHPEFEVNSSRQRLIKTSDID